MRYQNLLASTQLRYFAALLMLVTLLVLTVLVYGPYISSPLVFDDKPYFGGPFVARCAAEINLFSPRFLSCASFAHQYFLQGPSFEPLRWGNLLLHALVAWTLYLLIVELLTLSTTLRRRYVKWTTLAAVLLFAVHPFHVYAIGYLVERSIVMATLGMLLMWLAWLRVLSTGSQRWLIVVVVAYYIAIFSKEHAILALAGPMALSILLRRQYPRFGREMLLAYLLCIALGILAIYNTRSVLGNLYEPMGSEVLQKAIGPDIYLRSMQTQCGLFFKYLIFFLVPNPLSMSVDMREPLLASAWTLKGWSYVGAYLLFGLMAFAFLLRRSCMGLIGFALLMPWVLFGTELASVRAQEIFVLYRAYIWFPTLAIPIALAIALMSRHPALRWVALVAWLVSVLYFINATQNRLNTFVSSYVIWDDAVRLIETQQIVPMFAERAYNNRGSAMVETGHPAQALPDIDRAIKLNANLCAFHRTRATALSKLKRYDEALASYNRALGICPHDGGSFFGRFQVEEALGQTREALIDVGNACLLDVPMACFIESRLKEGVDKDSIFQFNIKVSGQLNSTVSSETLTNR